jgi:hypothetical protein
MKILAIVNLVDAEKIKRVLGLYNTWLATKLNLSVEYDLQVVAEPLEFVSYGQYRGLNFNSTNRWNSDATGCQVIVYFYQSDETGLANFTTLIDGRPQIQIVCNNNFSEEQIKRELEHEMIHGFFANLRAKGINLIDELDTHTDISGEDIELNKIRPFQDKLSEPLPIDGKINILLKIIEVLKNAIAMISHSRIHDWAVAMSEFEGFPIQGSVAQKNNNPINLRWSKYQDGQRDGFAYFNDVATGWKAAEFQLTIAADGRSQYYLPDFTLKHFFEVYAPRYENNPLNYANYVAGRLGVSIETKIKDLL